MQAVHANTKYAIQSKQQAKAQPNNIPANYTGFYGIYQIMSFYPGHPGFIPDFESIWQLSGTTPQQHAVGKISHDSPSEL